MLSSKQLTDSFFFDLKRYNNRNFKEIERADLTKQDAAVHKAFSSVVTRYFIFKEKHPEISETEHKILYFKLKLDLIATYFSEFPDTTTDNLVAFQLELKKWSKEHRHDFKEGDEENGSAEQESPLSNIGLDTDNEVSVEQQPESVTIAS